MVEKNKNIIKRIALVAHDARKNDLISWAGKNSDTLKYHDLYATGTTGSLLKKNWGFEITCLKSGPLGGDQQLGAMIANEQLDIMIFFWDPMSAQPHDVDVKALLRMSVLYNIPSACNRATADFMISSPYFNHEYSPIIKNYGKFCPGVE
ncbi:MAG: methylglyoxal synthase [Desulfobacteraceae bacterium]|nr:methylglyoxal synthase [Desulfobacteraceae bacterium]